MQLSADEEASLIRKKVSMLAEVQAPLRSARLLLLYPAALAWAFLTALESQVSLLRDIVTGGSTQLDSLLAFGVAALVVFVSVWARRIDQRAEADSLVDIATYSPQLERERQAKLSQRVPHVFVELDDATDQATVSDTAPQSAPIRRQNGSSGFQGNIVVSAPVNERAGKTKDCSNPNHAESVPRHQPERGRGRQSNVAKRKGRRRSSIK